MERDEHLAVGTLGGAQVEQPAAHRDPGFLAEAAKLGIDISPVGAGEMARGIEQLARSSPATFDYMKRLLAAEKGG